MTSKRPPAAPSAKPAMRVSWEALARAKAPEAKPATPWTVPTPAPGVLPEGAGMAMDSAIGGLYDYAQQMSPYGVGVSFLGYPLLAELSLIAEYRRMALTLSQEMTREWGKVVSSGDDDKTLKIKLLEEAMDGFRLRDVFREAAEMDALFGKAHIYIDVGVSDDRDELATPLVASPRKIRKGSLRRIKTVEPIWTSPGTYNSSDPLADSFYRPQSWYVMGKEIHHTRLLTLISREVPDILKPAFFFGGVSLSALARPYIDGWHRTRKSVSDLLHSFTIWNLQTDMMATLGGGNGEDMATRAQLFNDTRDSRGLMMTDKTVEALENISVPLSTLDALQAQAQEQICSVDGFPIVVLLGLSPHGLNATAEPEMDVWRNRVRAQQEHLFNRPLKKIMDFIQLSEFGEIDDSLAWQWNDLKQQDGLQEANIRKIDADAAVELINAGVLSPEEIRQHLASQEDSPYSNIDVSDVPVPPEDPNADPFGMSADPEPEVPGAPSVQVPQAQVQPQMPQPVAAHDAAQEVAADAWITVKPNGPDAKGQPVLIGAGGIVEGGLGGKFDGKHIGEVHGNPGRANSRTSAHAAFGSMGGSEPSEAKPSEKAGGDYKSSRANAWKQSSEANASGTRESHESAAAAHNQAHADAQTDEEKARHLSQKDIHETAIKKIDDRAEYEDLANKARELSKSAKTKEEHEAAIEAHRVANKKTWTSGPDFMDFHETNAAKHEFMDAVRHHKSAISRLEKKESRQARKETDAGKAAAAKEATFAKSTPEEVASHFKEKYGLGFSNGSNAERELNSLRLDYRKNYFKLTDEQRRETSEKIAALSTKVRSSDRGRIQGHTEYDITDGGPGGKGVRKVLGHIDATLSDMTDRGFDMKAALSKGDVVFAAGTTGKAMGHAWVHKGKGYFAISITKRLGSEIEQQQQKMAADRKARGLPDWSISSGSEDSTRATIIHELAHAIGLQGHIDSPKRLRGILDGLRAEQHGGDNIKLMSWIKSNISEYATSNIKETDAELAAKVTHPDYVRGTLPKVLEDHVDWLFEGKR